MSKSTQPAKKIPKKEKTSTATKPPTIKVCQERIRFLEEQYRDSDLRAYLRLRILSRASTNQPQHPGDLVKGMTGLSDKDVTSAFEDLCRWGFLVEDRKAEQFSKKLFIRTKPKDG